MNAASAVERVCLEIGERNRVQVIVAVVAFLLAFGFLGVAVLHDDGAEPEAERGAQSFATRRVASAKGGYELEAPRSWEVEKRGRAVTLSSPAGDIFVTVAPAPRGDLADAANEIFQSAAATYSKVTFLGASRQTIGRREAVVFSGKGTNDEKVRLRFVGATFNDGGRNHSMTAFTRGDSGSERVLSRIQKILNTFTATRS
ncbi:MAG: hypothetical protein ACRDK3_00285 [Actinomycetota bacterium]